MNMTFQTILNNFCEMRAKISDDIDAEISDRERLNSIEYTIQAMLEILRDKESNL
jgi:hypothetical protein